MLTASILITNAGTFLDECIILAHLHALRDILVRDVCPGPLSEEYDTKTSSLTFPVSDSTNACRKEIVKFDLAISTSLWLWSKHTKKTDGIQ